MSPGKQALSTCAVHLDSSNLRPGETVSGDVLLDVQQELHVDKVLIKAVGYEQTSWHIPHGSSTAWEKHRRDLFCAVAYPEGYAQPTVLAAGTRLKLPFKFVLPEGLPGSFQFAEKGHDHIRAKIRYKVVAQVVQGGGGGGGQGASSGCLQAGARLWVQEPQARPGASRVAVEDTQEVEAWWCLHRGSVQMHASLQQECHVPGDEVVVRLEVDSSASGASFKEVFLALRRHVHLCAGERVHHQASEVLARSHARPRGGLQAGSRHVGSGALELRLRLPDDVQPTALGELAHSEFSLHITLKALGVWKAPHLELPLVICQTADHLTRHSVPPPGWDQALVAPLTTLKLPPTPPTLPAKQALEQ